MLILPQAEMGCQTFLYFLQGLLRENEVLSAAAGFGKTLAECRRELNSLAFLRGTFGNGGRNEWETGSYSQT